MKKIAEVWQDITSGKLPILFDSEHVFQQGISPISKYSNYESDENGYYDLSVVGVKSNFFQMIEAEVRGKLMSDRPHLDKKLDSVTFQNFYYLKEELVQFCKQEGIQTSGGKIDLTKRISHYLDTGEKLISKIKSKKLTDIGSIEEDTLIEKDFVCSENHRAFFKQKLGNSFSFNVLFQNWLKSNTGKIYGDAISAYHQILANKKKGKTTIDKQFEYNTYIRDFFTDNNGKTLNDAIKCWKYKKSIQGHNRYEKSDLITLDQK